MLPPGQVSPLKDPPKGPQIFCLHVIGHYRWEGWAVPVSLEAKHVMAPIWEGYSDWGRKLEEVWGSQSVVPNALPSPESPGYSEDLSQIPTVVNPGAEGVWIKGLENSCCHIFHTVLWGNIRIWRVGFKSFTDNKLFPTESEDLMFLWDNSVIFISFIPMIPDSRIPWCFCDFFHSTHRPKEIPRGSSYKVARPK